MFGHGVTWDEEENVAREEQERHKPLTKLPALERMTKRLGQNLMEKNGDGYLAQHLVQKQEPAPSSVQANTWGMERPPTAGIGSTRWNLVSPRFDTMWDFSLRKIRQTDAVPLAMLRSQSFSADKGNQKPASGGKRVMHACCSMCMAWHSGIHGRAERIDRPDLAHGGLPHRSSESALTVVQQSQWRLNEMGTGGRALELRWHECVWRE